MQLCQEIVWRLQIAEFPRDEELGLQFGERTLGVTKELAELASCWSSLPLRDVARYGHCRSAHLCRRPKQLLSGEGLGGSINADHQGHCLLPDNQVLVIPLHGGSQAVPRSPGLTTDN